MKKKFVLLLDVIEMIHLIVKFSSMQKIMTEFGVVVFTN